MDHIVQIQSVQSLYDYIRVRKSIYGVKFIRSRSTFHVLEYIQD